MSRELQFSFLLFPSPQPDFRSARQNRPLIFQNSSSLAIDARITVRAPGELRLSRFVLAVSGSQARKVS